MQINNVFAKIFFSGLQNGLKDNITHPKSGPLETFLVVQMLHSNCILDDLKKDTSEWKSEQKLDFYKFEADKQVTKN